MISKSFPLDHSVYKTLNCVLRVSTTELLQSYHVSLTISKNETCAASFWKSCTRNNTGRVSEGMFIEEMILTMVRTPTIAASDFKTNYLLFNHLKLRK